MLLMEAEKCWFYVVKVLKNWPKIAIFSNQNNLNELLALDMHFLIARPARSDPRNSFVVRKKKTFLNFFLSISSCFDFKSWHVSESYQFISYWFWTSLDMFENHMNCKNSYYRGSPTSTVSTSTISTSTNFSAIGIKFIL
jgi:hypothetical protein